MATKLEEVAMAICSKAPHCGARPFEPYQAPPETVIKSCYCGYWKKYRAKAERAVAAMRDPTPVMLRSGENEDDHTTSFVQGASAEEHWHAMIDAILKE